jgi:hypothetical protein
MDSAFQIDGDADRLLVSLCPIDDKGRITFGFDGHTQMPATQDQLLAGWVLMIDYIMEGFVTYYLSAERTGDGLRLLVRKTGTNRDKWIDSSIAHYLKSLGLTSVRILL